MVAERADEEEEEDEEEGEEEAALAAGGEQAMQPCVNSPEPIIEDTSLGRHQSLISRRIFDAKKLSL